MVSPLRWRSKRGWLAAATLALVTLFCGCSAPVAKPVVVTPAKPPVEEPKDLAVPPPAALAVRPYRGPAVTGDEIIVAGQRFHTGTRVVTWSESGGHNAYAGTAAPGLRASQEKNRNSLGALQRSVDQFILHYDGAGLSRVCFTVLQQRKLSVHLLLDLDGTVYQTMDLQDHAAHATIANERSIGLEIANVGAYAPAEAKVLDEWYRRKRGQTVITVPPRFKNTGLRTPGFVGHPARPELVRAQIAGKPLVQYDYTPEQYAALIKLTAALCRVFPRLRDDFPHDAGGRLITQQLSETEWKNFQGILGHFHVQGNKIDPGPAFQWHELIEGVRAELK
jgi:N-acetyl-anhydromuramyl-L-alanine amidase AmpD